MYCWNLYTVLAAIIVLILAQDDVYSVNNSGAKQTNNDEFTTDTYQVSSEVQISAPSEINATEITTPVGEFQDNPAPRSFYLTKNNNVAENLNVITLRMDTTNELIDETLEQLNDTLIDEVVVTSEEFSVSTSVEELNIIQTKNGPVRGYAIHEDPLIYGFIDVPYGQFDGLFQVPLEADIWTEIRQATEHTKRCPQLQDSEVTGDLDCLTLSIFTPENPVGAPVLFHIHDGSFKTGSADHSVYGPNYLVPKGVILVLPNYRLGPLGFLCARNDASPGNAALKDLTLALNWTASNINLFGGDPANIAVSGLGMAGSLVGFLALSPLSRPYISKAITESGSVLSDWALDRDPVKTAMELAIALSQNNNTTDMKSIYESNLTNLILASDHIEFRPCIEEENNQTFLSDTPWKVLHNNKINITFMIGSADHAGLHDMLEYTDEIMEVINTNFSELLPNDLVFEDDKEEVALKIKLQYFGEDTVTAEQSDLLSLYHTDAYYLGPGIRVSRLLNDAGAQVYFYEFSFVGDLNREVMALPMQLGAAKGDMVGYVFAQDGTIPEADSDEEHMVDLLTDLWISFMETGVPVAPVPWNPLTSSQESDEAWLSIGSEVSLEKGVHVARLALWTQIYRDHYVDSNLAIKLDSTPYYALICVLVFTMHEHV